MPDLLCATRGLLILMLVVLGSTSRAQTDPLSVGSVLSITRLASQQQAATQAATIVAGEATTDSDGFPLSAAVGSGSGPVGGGVIPTGSAAPKADSFGTVLGYCAWDNGSVTSAAGHLVGANDVSKPVLAIVATGLDGVFQTSCSDIWTSGSAKGDDYIVVISTWQIRHGIGGTLYFGNPVADSAALSALAASGLKDGEIILTKVDNRLWRWNSNSTSWAPVVPTGFTPAPNGTDVLANGRVGIGTSANPAYPLQVVTTTGIPIGIQSGSLPGIALINASGSQVGFQGFDVAANRMLLDVRSAGATFALRIGGTDRLTVDAIGNLTVSAAINATSGYQVNGITVIDGSRNIANIGTLSLGGAINTINGYTPTNGAIRLTPNLMLNAMTGYAVILNWDNGTTGNAMALRVGNGASADAFYVTAAGNVVANGNITAASFNSHTTQGGSGVLLDSANQPYATAMNQYVRSTDSPTFQEIYANGWFRSNGDAGWYNQKWGGGWYMSDSAWVRSYSDKNVYTGGQMQAGTIQSNGRLTANEYIQVNGTAAERSVCSQNGLIAQNGAGLILSCQSGQWVSNKTPIQQLSLFQCPSTTDSLDGPWASYGCVGQISTSPTCKSIVPPYTITHACVQIQ